MRKFWNGVLRAFNSFDTPMGAEAELSPLPTAAAAPQSIQAKGPTTIVFCIPGQSFSRNFIISWSALFAYCVTHGINPVLSTQYSCNIYYSRNMCLSGDVLKGVDQKPFGGKIKYDYIMWIDSDVLFSVEQFVALLASAPKNPIVSGVYRMTNGEYAAVEKWDTEYFKKNGHFKFLKEEDINDYAKRTGPQVLVSVSYSGMGFMLIQRGVFEALSYPWFKPIEKKIGDAVDFTMEDVCFCLRAKHAGYKVLIDPRIRVGHEKSMII